jgi:hypothetical protein
MAKKKLSEEQTAPKTFEAHSDVFLRQHGFRICSRPDNGAPVWLRSGKEYSHARATAIAEGERDEALKELYNVQKGG